MSRTVKLSDYDLVISEVYSQLRLEYPTAVCIPFSKSHIEQVAKQLADAGKIRPIRNIPDIKYTYDARREFPETILKDGYWAISGKGKGQYELTRIKHNNLIRIPSDLEQLDVPTVELVDKTHPLVAQVLGHDEQATFRRIEANNLIDDFLGMTAYRLQGHERTSLSCGQIEVDEVYVASDGVDNYIVPISGKGGDKDFLSYTQAQNLARYTLEKTSFNQHIGCPLGVWQQPGGPIYIIEFSCSPNIDVLKIIRAKAYTLLSNT